MLRNLTVGTQVYLVTGYNDMRRSIDKLAAIVQGQLHLDPFSKALFLFCGFWEGLMIEQPKAIREGKPGAVC